MSDGKYMTCIRNYSASSEPMTSHALGGLAGSRQMLLYMRIINPTTSVNGYFLVEQSNQISSDLKQRSLFEVHRPTRSTRRRRITSWVAIR